MISPDFQKSLFKEEIQVLENAKNLTKDLVGNPLIDGEYKKLLDSYERLLTLSRKIVKISDNQGKILIKREKDIKTILDNAGQGFLTFGPDLLINKEYSSECIRIFGKKIARQSILELLEDSPQLTIFKEIITEIFEADDALVQYSLIEKMPKTIEIEGRYYAASLRIIKDLKKQASREKIIMMILTDITEKQKAQEEINFLSYHDKLTSLYNRAYIDKWLSYAGREASAPFSVIIADLNGLKLINDVFGHSQGDQLLQYLAQVLNESCRKTDIVARWGGDEFLILLPNTDKQACFKVCERIKDNCKKTKDLPIELSTALGFATQKHPGGDIEYLLRIAENKMYKNKLLESKEVQSRIIQNMDNRLNEKCPGNKEHVERIKDMASDFIKYTGNEEIEYRNLSTLAELHDIGKLAIPQEILHKPEQLSPAQWKVMHRHSEIGYRLAQSIGESLIADAILSFHERWDGKGYPLGIKGENIPFISRLLSLIDVYDVMIHDQPYRPALSVEKALGEIKNCAGTQFDPQLAEQFLAYILGTT